MREWQDIFQGTGAIYAVESDGHVDIIMGDYLFEAMPESWPEQFRAYRQQLLESGKRVPNLPEYSPRDKVLITFGPEVSADQAVAALERAIESIKGNGLLTGRDHHRDLIWEHTDGTRKPR